MLQQYLLCVQMDPRRIQENEYINNGTCSTIIFYAFL